MSYRAESTAQSAGPRSTLRRVLVVASTFPADPSDPVPGFVRDQVIAMKECEPGIEFTVLAPHDRYTRTRRHVEHEHYTERRFHYAWPHRWEALTGRGILPALREKPLRYALVPGLFLGEFLALLRWTRTLAPDVIYAHWFTPQALSACAVSALTGVPFVFTTHAADVDVWHKVPFMGRLLVRWGTRRARAVTAVSRRSMAKLAAFMPDRRPPASKSEIIPMGVALPELAVADADVMHLGPDLPRRPVLLFLGRLAGKKGVDHLLHAMARVVASQDVSLLIAGDGPLRGELESLALELGISERVSFLGYTTGADKDRVLRTTDLLVLPSIVTDGGDAEGMPVVLMEGLAYGRLCVATDVSGADDVLTDGVDGFLVPQRDPVALAVAIERALTLSEESRSSMAAAARRTAIQFEWSAIARRHLDFFERFLLPGGER